MKSRERERGASLRIVAVVSSYDDQEWLNNTAANLGPEDAFGRKKDNPHLRFEIRRIKERRAAAKLPAFKKSRKKTYSLSNTNLAVNVAPSFPLKRQM